MQTKNYPAFGYVMCRTSLLAGEIVNDDLMTNNIMVVTEETTPTNYGKVGTTGKAYLAYVFNGVHVFKNVETGQVHTQARGYCSLDQGLPVGTYKFTVAESSDFLCFSTSMNSTKPLPTLSNFKLAAGESTTLPQGTQLYFAEGLLSINDVIFPSMRQIRVANEDKLVTAVSDCYGFIFKNT
jgi:hypothetical protein